MKYLGLYSSQNVDEFFEKSELKTLLCFTEAEEIMVRIGYQCIEQNFVFRILAIQIDNSPTYETFEMFEMDEYQTKSDEELKNYARLNAEKVIRYNSEILNYYIRK